MQLARVSDILFDAVAIPLRARFKRVTIKTIPVYAAIVGLIVFAKPQPFWFVIGFIFIMSGETFRIWAVGHLRKTKEVTTTGPYAYVKNPLYLGTFLILVGFCTMASNVLLLAIGLPIFMIYYVPFKKKREGDRLRNKFGLVWEDYDRAVPDYIPRLYPYAKAGNRPWSKELFFENSEHGTLIMVILGTLILLGRFLF